MGCNCLQFFAGQTDGRTGGHVALLKKIITSCQYLTPALKFSGTRTLLPHMSHLLLNVLSAGAGGTGLPQN